MKRSGLSGLLLTTALVLAGAPALAQADPDGYEFRIGGHVRIGADNINPGSYQNDLTFGAAFDLGAVEVEGGFGLYNYGFLNSPPCLSTP